MMMELKVQYRSIRKLMLSMLEPKLWIGLLIIRKYVLLAMIEAFMLALLFCKLKQMEANFQD